MSDVTLVIPVYNRAAYLPRLFQSLQRLNYPELSVILVDNGSTDDSLSLCQTFAEEAHFPVEVVQEMKRGANAARNRGLSLCCTRWVYFFDSDDEISPDFLDKIQPGRRDSDVIFFPTCQQVGDRRMVRDYRVSDSAVVQILTGMLNTQSLVWNADFLRGIGGWNEQLSVWQDWELGVRLLLHRPRISWYTSEAFHCIYVHQDSITGPSFSANLQGRVESLKTVGEEVCGDASAMRALYYRTKILEGMLSREGGAGELWPRVSDAQVSLAVRVVGKLLRKYVALGGRGAWRIALKSCSA